MKLQGVALSAVLVALAWQYAGARPRHRAVASFAAVALAADVLHWTLAVFVLGPARAQLGSAEPPFAGVARAAFHLQQAAFLVFPFGLGALAAAVFLEEPLRRRAGALAAALWALACLGLAVGYPTVRRALLARCYLAVELAALAAVIACGWAWWKRREMPSLTEGSVMLLGAVQVGALVQWAPFGKGWDWQSIVYFVGYGALVFLHVGEVWSLKQQSR